MDLVKLGENIQYFRNKNHLTQTQLAEKLFVSFQAVSNWERGITAPDIENLCKLSNLLNISVDRLLKSCEQSGVRYMIGIDGGGTKTEFALFSEDGNVVSTIKLTSSNPNDIGMENSCKILEQGIDSLLELVPDVSGIFAGIAGGITGNNKGKLSAFLKSRYNSIDVYNDSDILNLLASGDNSENRIALVCGTGSVAYVYFEGKGHLIGGWGPFFDNSGSAYDIGKDAVCAALAQQEGRGEKTLITELFGASLNGKIRDSLDNLYREGKPYIASLAPYVFTAHSFGDKIAAEIIRKTARHLADLVTCAQNQYSGGNSVVAGGGVFENYKEILLPMIQEFITTETKFIFPSLPPIYGACRECCCRMNIQPGEAFRAAFSKSYAAQSERNTVCYEQK